MSATTVRRGLFGMFAGGLLAFGSAAIVAPVANAAPDACSQSGIATTASSVSASTAAYLAAHPQTNQELTDIATQQPAEQAEQAYQAYFERNPQVENELQAINQPATDLSTQCGIAVTPTPISEVLQTL
jgi:hemophore-related protein